MLEIRKRPSAARPDALPPFAAHRPHCGIAVAFGTAGETACPTLLDFACQRKLIQIKLQLDVLCRQLPAPYIQAGDCYRQLEAAWAGAAWVQVQHASLHTDRSLVGMAADHRLKSGRYGIEV